MALVGPRSAFCVRLGRGVECVASVALALFVLIAAGCGGGTKPAVSSTPPGGGSGGGSGSSQLTVTTNALTGAAVGANYNATLTASGGTAPYTWSVTSGHLPAGFALSASTGAITGSSPDIGSYPLTFSVTDSGNPQQTSTANLSLALTGGPLFWQCDLSNSNNSLQITTRSLPGGVVGKPYSTTLAGNWDGSFVWEVDPSTLPQGLTLNSMTGTISGTPLMANPGPLFALAAETGDPTQCTSAYLDLEIVTASTHLYFIPGAFLPLGNVGPLYTGTLPLGGNGTPPYTWAVTDGSLPDGLTLNSATGVISGYPSSDGFYTFTLSVTDSSNPAQTAQSSQQLTIFAYPFQASAPPQMTTSSLPGGTVGSPYNATVVVTGGVQPYTWWYRGTLPDGLTVNAATGAITGTPTVAGTFTPEIDMAGSNGPGIGKPLPLTIVPAGAPVSISTSSLPGGTEGTAYSTALAASGGNTPDTWALMSGTLPNGLILNSSTGVISGTPTAAGSNPLTFTVTDSSNPAQSASSMSLTLALASPTMSISTAALPNGAEGTGYGVNLEADGGTPPYLWSLTNGAMPPGLMLDTGSGALFGTPTASANAAPLTFSVTDSSTPAQTILVTLPLTITVAPVINMVTYYLVPGSVGAPYSETLSAFGGTEHYTWSVTGGKLPPGLTLNPSTGVISGTPTSAFDGYLTLTVTDTSVPAQSRSFSAVLTIYGPPAISITTATLPDGQVGVPYYATLEMNGGMPPYTWTLLTVPVEPLQDGPLPAGLTLDPSTGVISGTPTVAGTSPLIFNVMDSSNPPLIAGSGQMSLTIKP